MGSLKFRAWVADANLLTGVTAIELNSSGPKWVPLFDNVAPPYSCAPRYGMSTRKIGAHRAVLRQYTGLKDKNGVEIYEGDIVSIRFYEGLGGYFSYEEGVIKWNEKSSAFKWFASQEDPSDENNYWLTHADADGREVIGNI